MIRATPAARFGSKPWMTTVLPLLLAVGAAALAVGCTASSDQVRPPADEFYFPTGLAASPGEEAVFVINANSDLRYASGNVVLVDAEAVDDLADPWVESGVIPDGCRQDDELSYLLNCDETMVTRPEGSVRLASFSTEIAVQSLDDGAARLFVASRGDPSVTFIDYDPDSQTLDCGGVERQPACDEEHRLNQLRDDPEIGRIVEEPYGLFVDSQQEYVAVTHLTSGSVTLIDAPANGGRPLLSDVITGIFASDRNGVRGAVGVAGRRPGSDGDLLYVTSRTDPRVQLLSVARPGLDGLPRIAPADFFFLEQVRPADDARDIGFSADGNRAYIVNREPPLLHIIDTSNDVTGKPTNRFLGGVELCAEAANLLVLDAGRGDRVYVSCFRSGQLWEIDPAGQVVEAIIDVGRGPNSMIGLPSRGKLLVTNFLEDTIAVVDVRPGSVFENRFVLRLGFTRQSEEQ